MRKVKDKEIEKNEMDQMAKDDSRLKSNSTAQSQLSGYTRRRAIKKAALTGAGLAVGQSVFLQKQGGNEAQAASADFDVVVVGAGAAGMTAALTAAKSGLKVIVVEKAPTFGGSAARSGAGIWIRCNEVILKAGVPDSPEKAEAYLAKVVGPEVSSSRQKAFLSEGPRMISFVMKHSPLRFRWMDGYSDYYPELPGGMPQGASIEPEQIDGNILGDELVNLNPAYMATPPGVVVYSADYKWITLALVSSKGAATALKCVERYTTSKFRGQRLLTMGQALAAGLRAGLMAARVPVCLNTPLVDFQFDESGKACGVTVLQNGVETSIKALRGVIVASGGFEHNLSMRQQFQAGPIGTEWTVGAKENTGDGIRAGERAGAALDLMEDAWWGPSIPLPRGPYFCLAERTLPGGIMVNGQGFRFVNEAAPYSDVVHTMYQLNTAEVSHIPSWLIFDQRYRNRYLFKDIPPAIPFPKEWYKSGVAFKDRTLAGLAKQIGMPVSNLVQTVERFNTFAKTGKDLDFKRGDSAYDHYYTDPNVKPNSCLAALAHGPFYALKIVPGDLGTKGGMRTDAQARVLREDNTVIPGLYAAGNCSGAVMGHSYAGAGSTIGPAMTFGFIAANTIASSDIAP
jgi:3-oxosteroid 1-dehydrogenase